MSDILKEVMSLRNELWSELLDFVNSIVKEIARDGWPQADTSMRMADYRNILDITCSKVGLSPKRIEKFILGMQAEIVKENDPIFAALEKMVDNPTHDPDKVYSSRELFEVLQRMHRKLHATYGSVNKFTRSLTGYIDNGSLERAGIKVYMRESGNNKTFSVESLK